MPDSKSRKQSMPRIVLHEFGPDDERPEMAVYALDANDNILAIARVDDTGAFNLSSKVSGEARFMILGPVAESLDDIPQEVTRRFYAEEFLNRDLITVVKPDWGRWVNLVRCISGDVRHCYFSPVLLNELVQFAEVDSVRDLTPTAASRRVTDPVLSRIRPFPGGIRFPFKCNPVCAGKIEVYERLCCRVPWDIIDPRIPDILDDLRVVIDPPFPPDPGPYSRLQYIKSGALDLKAVNARRDLAVLETLNHEQQLEYIVARPYLWPRWECGTGVKKGHGTINPDGSFTICWTEYPIIIDFCYKEYAFVITQEIDGVETTVYDGRAANQWFAIGDDITITILGRKVRSCRTPPVSNKDPYVILEHIGKADSWRLQTPPQSGPRSVSPVAADSGLADTSSNPYVSAHVPVISPRDRNWGGTLRLLYYFSDALKGLGAKYYRISYQAAGGSGAPAGAGPQYFTDGLSWDKWGGLGKTVPVVLGPFGTGDGLANDYLYQIPYGSEWQANQYHAAINTTLVDQIGDLPTKGRYLITIEIFDTNGKRLRPNGVGNEAGFVPADEKGFKFLRWVNPDTEGVNVDHSALTHLFWWDNSPIVGEIVDLRQGSVPNTAECQYLCTDSASETFSVGYRAYFPGNQLFFWTHSLKWQRGLGGTPENLSVAGPGNVGEPPAGPDESGTATFSDMLGQAPDPANPGGPPIQRKRCTFSVRLIADAKTFDGEHNLYRRFDETASFALQISDECQ